MINLKLFRTAILTVALCFAGMAVGQQHADNTQNINDFLQPKQKIKVVNGSVFANFANQKVTSQEIVSSLNRLLKLDEKHSFEKISQKEDEMGFTHTNFQEYYSGYPVDGHIIMFHEKDGLLKSISGNAATLKNIDIQINITDSQAISIAKEHLRVTELFRETPIQTVFAKNQKDQKFYLTKKVRIESFSPLVRYDVFVDVKTGEVVKKISLIYNADVQATAQTLFKGVQTITCDSRPNGSYRLYDNARKIGTYNGQTWMPIDFENFDWDDPYASLVFPSENLLFSNNTTTWSTNRPALDIHWGMEQTYDYYLNTFNRNSYDGNGGEIFNVYNPAIIAYLMSDIQFNAAAITDGLMIYGTGGNLQGGYQFNPFVGLDVTGHEFTHLVTGKNGNGGLDYEGEAGALNESFSDIFGTCIEFFTGVSPNWTIGEDILTNGSMRSMSNPNNPGAAGNIFPRQPDTYFGTYWVDANDIDYDNGGVHINSGVQNFWFYLLCEGGTGTNDLGDNYVVNSIGMDAAQRIAYRNLMTYLAPTANFISSYHGSLQAAEDLFGNPSAEYSAVEQAWFAVGIDSLSEITCSRLPVNLTAKSGSFNDGSGTENYRDNQECKWVISPPNALSITLSFSDFDTEEADTVYIYNSNANYNQNNPLASYSGNQIPNDITSSTGVMIVTFISDGAENAAGWTANYNAIVSSGLDEIEDSKIAVFPNPAKNIVNIQFAENQQDAVIEIYDVVGKLVQQFPKQNINANTVQSINIENIPNGIYNINIISNAKKTNHKLIISR